MAEHGEWTRKGATLSEITAADEYGVGRDFIIKGINAGKLEFREGSMWGNPYIRILRSQLEIYIADAFSQEYLKKVRDQFELKTIKKQISATKKKLNALELQKKKLRVRCFRRRNDRPYHHQINFSCRLAPRRPFFFMVSQIRQISPWDN